MWGARGRAGPAVTLRQCRNGGTWGDQDEEGKGCRNEEEQGWRGEGLGGVGIRDIGCRDEERQGERVVGIRSSSDRAGLPSERRCGRCGGAGRWQQRPSAGPRCGGGAAGGVPEGRGGSAGIPATLVPPSSPPGLQRRVEEMPLVQPSRGHAHGSSPDTDTGGSGCAGCPFPQSSMAGNSRLRWRRALPGIFVGAGAVNSIFFSPCSLCRVPVSPPPSLLLFSGVPGLFASPPLCSTLMEPCRGDTGSQRQQLPGTALPLMRVGTALAVWASTRLSPGLWCHQ